ncbi:MAG: ATP-dependent Clp protease adaptor ClpS [Planctomycetes bacterium]|nr:ATP-dependent Clp protease adaptor ClpS [Planctomycetota bacterium]
MHSLPESDSEVRTRRRRAFVVVLYNDDVHSFDEVVLQVQKATGKSQEAAFRVTLEAHLRGKSVAFAGGLEECQRAAAILRRIRLQVEVDDG